MMKLWFLFLALCCALASCEERLEDKMVEEDKGLGEENLSSFGGTVLNNKFSSGTPPVASDHPTTTTMDTNTTLEDSPPVTTVSSKDVVSTETKEPATVSNPPPTFTTHKIDPKKDVKKKNKLTFKKKDKNLDDEETMESNHETKAKIDETTTSLAGATETVTENVPTVVTTHANPTTTDAVLETTTESQETTEKPHGDTMRLGREESDTTTTEAALLTLQGNMLSDNQETTPQNDLSQTTMIPDLVHETMADTKESESSQTTTNEPTMVETTVSPQEEELTTTPEVLIVTENNEAATTINSMPVDPVTEVLMKSGKSDEEEEDHTVANEAEHTVTTTQENEISGDHNNLNNDLGDEGMSHETTTVHPEMDEATSSPTVRKQKQMDLDNPEGPCLCDEPKVVVSCVGDRTLPDPNCPCRATCARQSGESCSPGEPCDEEFGLRCNLQNNTCHGEYKLFVFILPAINYVEYFL
ncbi:IGFBP N-terminal domain-containing protein [Nephila pilipes]|uniref:IGFBP N-terminal domain-containing protein n=1 Tax=Nephila pilipes TaxID=299642 RepID=A0A8X6P6G6_NEPPI|nr:IGFBP N-terminal domain-containing protein [Nephila pilipes]